jgi:membrane-associated protein
MDALRNALDLFLHLDVHLAEMSAHYGGYLYAILFAIVFCETGLVVTPFLPGDSLLFAAGSLAALGADEPGGGLSPHVLVVLLSIAAILGDTVNYAIGARVGPRVFRDGARFLKRRHLERTHAFYEKYGGRAIVFARFVPIVRTFAPFVAGIGAMSYGRFLAYNVIGGIVWVVGFVYAGYFFGNLPAVKENFTLVILAIIFLSILPGIIEVARARRARRAPGLDAEA